MTLLLPDVSALPLRLSGYPWRYSTSVIDRDPFLSVVALDELYEVGDETLIRLVFPAVG